MAGSKSPDDTHERIASLFWDTYEACTTRCCVHVVTPTEWTAVDQATEREGTVEQALEDAFDFGGVFDG